MRVGEKPRATPALSPRNMRMTEDASRSSSTPFVESGYTPNTANRLGQAPRKGPLGPAYQAGRAAGVKKSKGQPQTSLNLGIGKQKRNKRND